MGGPICIYQKELDKTCFQLDVTYGDFKVLPWRTVSNKVLHNQALDIAKNPNYDERLKYVYLLQ